ncbi:MAG: hypothetical protein OXH15_03050 [Gammaproteobacteria bacterium]|nr:hypothetical protein [Gammaproteobacteria bacterium]
MPWSDDQARDEFAWLKLMARLKYDGYRDFRAGMRFIESLATWLQQFAAHHRETAYQFVRHALVYIGPGEMQKLVEQFFPHTVRSHLKQLVADQHHAPSYRVLVDPKLQDALEVLQRKTLFMGLSDGARIDTIRHANARHLNNEQVVQGTQVDVDKWRDLLDNLRKDLSDPKARFQLVYLIDDFTATGTSFLRFDLKTKSWKGKLCRFKDSVDNANRSLQGDAVFVDDWRLCIHHYIASANAAQAINQRLPKAIPSFGQTWATDTSASFGTILPPNLPIDHTSHPGFVALTNTYYDPVLRTKHTDIGGAKHLGLGYGACALPVVLEHNTPNNSVALLWAETDGGSRENGVAPPMRPLFRRRHRHT